MRILLDSNAYSRLMRGDDQTAAVVRDATEVLMSAVVIGELLYGFRNGSRFDRNAADLSPNPPKDTDGRREDRGRGVRELQAR